MISFPGKLVQICHLVLLPVLAPHDCPRYNLIINHWLAMHSIYNCPTLSPVPSFHSHRNSPPHTCNNLWWQKEFPAPLPSLSSLSQWPVTSYCCSTSKMVTISWVLHFPTSLCLVILYKPSIPRALSTTTIVPASILTFANISVHNSRIPATTQTGRCHPWQHLSSHPQPLTSHHNICYIPFSSWVPILFITWRPHSVLLL